MNDDSKRSLMACPEFKRYYKYIICVFKYIPRIWGISDDETILLIRLQKKTIFVELGKNMTIKGILKV